MWLHERTLQSERARSREGKSERVRDGVIACCAASESSNETKPWSLSMPLPLPPHYSPSTCVMHMLLVFLFPFARYPEAQSRKGHSYTHIMSSIHNIIITEQNWTRLGFKSAWTRSIKQSGKPWEKFNVCNHRLHVPSPKSKDYEPSWIGRSL